MTAVSSIPAASVPAFCEGIQYFSEAMPGFEQWGQAPAIALGAGAVSNPGRGLSNSVDGRCPPLFNSANDC
jgi:hypothetical protein